MPVIELHDRAGWNALLLEQPSQAGIFLQSFEWGEFQKAVGRRVWRLGVRDQVSGVRFAQVIELPLPFGKKYWLVSRGTVIDGLIEEAQKRGTLFLRVEPIIGMLQEVTKSYKRLQGVTLVRTKSVNPAQTLIVDLTKSEDELLSAMHEKTRYNVRLALRKGVELHPTPYTLHAFEEFWKLMRETSRRDKFRTHPRGYYEKMLNVGRPSAKNDKLFTRLHLAYHGTTPLAAAIVAYFGDTATYLHGASSYAHRALMGPYALHWSIMREAKKQGYKYYDFWGVSTRVTSYDSWTGMTRFKIGFGGQVVDYPGTFDLPLNKIWYIVYRFGRKIL